MIHWLIQTLFSSQCPFRSAVNGLFIDTSSAAKVYTSYCSTGSPAAQLFEDFSQSLAAREFVKGNTAATYFPTQSPRQYHRRGGA